MTLDEIRGRFDDAIRADEQGALVLDSALLTACGVDPRLVSSLPGRRLRLAAPTLGEVADGAFLLEGDAAVAGADLVRLSGVVHAAGGESPRAALRAALDGGWSFRRSLPALPGYLDTAGGTDGPAARDSLFYELPVDAPAVLLSSYAFEDERFGPVVPGLNFASGVRLDGPLAFIRRWGPLPDDAALVGVLDLSGPEPFAALSVKLPLSLSVGPASLDDAYLGLFCVPRKGGRRGVDVGLELDAAVRLGGMSVQLGSRLEIGSSRVTLEGVFSGLGLRSLEALATDLGVDDLSSVLPPGLTELPIPELRFGRVVLDLERGVLEEVRLGMVTPAPWPLLPGMALDRLAFELGVRHPLSNDRTVDSRAYGRFRLGDGTFLFLRGMYPGFSVSGRLAAGSRLRLNELLGNPAFQLPPVTLPGDTVVTSLGFEATPGTGPYAFNLEVEGDWVLPLALPGGAGLALQGVSLALRSAERPSGSIVGSFDVMGVPIFASAELTEEGGTGLVLEGGTAPGAEVSLRQLAASLLAAAGLPLPPIEGDILFRDLSLRVDTRPESRAFILNGSSSLATPLHLPGGGAALQLTLGMRDVGYNFAAGRFAGHFHGAVQLDETVFTVTADIGETEQRVDFQQGAAPLYLTALLSRLVPGGVALPPELPGIEGLTISGIAGRYDLRTNAYTFQGTASVARFTAGTLTLSDATGSLELKGAGARLEELTLRVSAHARQELVPELQVETLSLELHLKHAGEAWEWRVGGSLAIRLLDLPSLTLTAEASDRRFHFKAETGAALDWSLGGVANGSFRRLELELARDPKSGGFSWHLEGAGALKVAALPRVSGTLGIYDEPDRKGFAFTADEGQEPLRVEIPLVPGMAAMTVGGSFLLTEFSILKPAEWEVSVASSLQLIVPQPAAPDPDDPLYRSLRLLNDLLGAPVSARLSASSAGVTLKAENLPRVPIPVPVLVNGELVMDRMGEVGLDAIELRLGASFTAEGTIALTLPEEINNVFGEENGRPKFRLINREFRMGLSVDSRRGLGVELGSAPIDLRGSGCFADETDSDGRKWTRFTLGPLTFRFAELPDAQDPGKRWWHFDFAELGEVAFLKPRLTFDGASFAASGGFHIVRDVRLPSGPLRAGMRQLGLDALADTLPDSIPLLDLHVLRDDGAGGKTLDADALLDVLDRIRRDTGVAVPVEELRPVLRLVAGQFNRMPAGFREYLDVTIPKQLELDIAFTPSAGFGLKLDVRAPVDPLRLLVPTPAGFQGITLRKLAIGELLSGSLLLVDVDVEVDQFDLVALGASLFLPAAVADTFTATSAIQNRLVARDVMVVVILATQIPIPVPVWFRSVGVQRYGLEGLEAQGLLNNNLANVTLVAALKGLVDLYRELKAFFTEPDRLLPADLFSRNGLNLGVNVTPGFVRLPKYLGGTLLGSEDTLLTLGVDQLLIPVANFLKEPDPGVILGLVPLELRNGVLGGSETGVEIGPFRVRAAWLFSTLQELDTLAAEPPERRCAFVQSLQRTAGGETSAFVSALRGVVQDAAGGGPHDGVVLYLAGGVDVDAPGLPVTLDAFSGLLVERGRGVLTQFRVTGTVGSLLAMDVGGLFSPRVLRGVGEAAPMAELLLSGHARLDVFGRRVVDASLALEEGVFTFHAALSLFPPGSGLQVDAQVEGRIARDTLWVHGDATVALPLLPVTGTRFELTYEYATVIGTWLEQEITLRISREAGDRYRFAGSFGRPVALLPGLVELSHGEDLARGPALALTGPALPALELNGTVFVPKLSSSGTGVVNVGPDAVDVRLSTLFLGRHRSALVVKGDSLDRPTSLAFTATFEGDLFAACLDGLKAGFDSLLEDARGALADAEDVFNREWANFTRLAEEGYHAVRAGILQSKEQVEAIIQGVNAKVDAVLELLLVNDGERAARQAFIRTANEMAQQGLQWFIDQLAAARRALEAKQAELAGLDGWYHGMNGSGKFWNWAYYAITRARLVIESQVLPAILLAAEQALEHARRAVPFIAEAVDAVLQELDRVRAALYDELQRHKQYILDRKAELDRYNEMLLLKADALLREFGRAVDTSVRDAAKQAFDAARGAVDALRAAGDYMDRHARAAIPFEIDRLTVSGSLSAVEGTRFKADADVWFNVFEQRRLATGIGFELDFSDVGGSARSLARQLWDRRDQVRFLEEWEVRRREEMRSVDAQLGALRSAMAAAGPQFGETLEKKVLFDMEWEEMVGFYQYARAEIARFPVLQRVVEVVERDYKREINLVLSALNDTSPFAQWTRRAALEALRLAEQQYKDKALQWVRDNQAAIDAALHGAEAQRIALSPPAPS